MIYVLGKVAIGDLSQFIGVFATRGAQARKEHGCLGAQVFKVSEDEGTVVVLLAWDSREAFDGFRNDAAVKETMKSGGMTGPPEFTILEELAEFPS